MYTNSNWRSGIFADRHIFTRCIGLMGVNIYRVKIKKILILNAALIVLVNIVEKVGKSII